MRSLSSAALSTAASPARAAAGRAAAYMSSWAIRGVIALCQKVKAVPIMPSTPAPALPQVCSAPIHQLITAPDGESWPMTQTAMKGISITMVSSAIFSTRSSRLSKERTRALPRAAPPWSTVMVARASAPSRSSGWPSMARAALSSSTSAETVRSFSVMLAQASGTGGAAGRPARQS